MTNLAHNPYTPHTILFSLRDERIIKNSDRIRAALDIIAVAITTEGDERSDPVNCATRAKMDRKQAEAGAMIDRLARIAEYIEQQE